MYVETCMYFKTRMCVYFFLNVWVCSWRVYVNASRIVMSTFTRNYDFRKKKISKVLNVVMHLSMWKIL